MALFQDIPQFTHFASYSVDVGWDYLPTYFSNSVKNYKLDINPDFQRGYVWTPNQRVRYVEYILQGGHSGKDIHTNSPYWNRGVSHESSKWWYVLVDGKQRIDAVLGFLSNEFPIFGGNFFRDYEDRLRITRASFRWHVNDLATYEEVLQWYIDLNRGGTVHSDEEIERVRKLQRSHTIYTPPTPDILLVQSGFDREIIREAMVEEEKYQRKMEESRALAAEEESRKPKRGKKRVK